MRLLSYRRLRVVACAVSMRVVACPSLWLSVVNLVTVKRLLRRAVLSWSVGLRRLILTMMRLRVIRLIVRLSRVRRMSRVVRASILVMKRVLAAAFARLNLTGT